MDPIAQLGRSAYHALCVAFAAQHKDKLYAPETDVLLEEARELLGISEDDDEAIRAQIEKDPMILSLRRGELPPGGLRLPAAPASAARAAAPSAYGGMPPPGGGGAAGYDTPFSAPAHQGSALQKMASKKSVSAAPPTSGYVGRKLQRLFPDLSPPWVTGSIVQFNPSNGKHLIQYGPPLRKELWDSIEDFAPANFRWVEPGSEPAAPAGGGSRAGGASKSGGGSKSGSRAPPPAPKAPPAPRPLPPPPPPPAPAPPPVPLLALPGGPSTFHGTGLSLTSAPYNDGFLKANLAKNRPEELFTMLASVDDREGAVVREVLSLLDDPGDIEEITRLLEQSQQLSAREQQLKAELRELGVLG